MDSIATRVFKFSTSDFPEHKRLAMYREIYGRTIVQHEIEPIGDRPFHFEGSLCSLPGLSVAWSLISPCRRWHGARHIESDDVVMGIGLSGACSVRQCGREAEIREGEAVVTSIAEPAEVAIGAPLRPIVLRMPNAVLTSRGIDVGKLLARRIERSPALALLTGYIQAIRDAQMEFKAEMRGTVVTHLHDLVCLTLGASGDALRVAEQRGVRAARLSGIMRMIQSRSADPALTASRIAARLGITPRYVHMLLEETGKSFTHHVLEARLQKASGLLRDALWRERRILDVALEAGFGDLSYFSRSFRRRFAMTPSEFRNAARSIVM